MLLLFRLFVLDDSLLAGGRGGWSKAYWSWGVWFFFGRGKVGVTKGIKYQISSRGLGFGGLCV